MSPHTTRCNQTDPHKIPVTVLSRCLQFNLKQLLPTQIFTQMEFILQQEAIEFEAAALKLLSRAADGSMRDGLSLLDQAIVYGNSKVTTVEVGAMLGTVAQQPVDELLNALAQGDALAIFDKINEIADLTPDHEAFQTIWISYWHWRADQNAYEPAGHRFVSHRPLAMPEFSWEKLKIGAGTPPVLCRHGWLIIYHGVQEAPSSRPDNRKYLYSAGLMILDRERPHHVLYRSPEPVLFPECPDELTGTVDGVVFPTGIDRRDDIGQPERFDVYYGMADDRVGVATFTIPEALLDSLGKAVNVVMEFKDISHRAQ